MPIRFDKTAISLSIAFTVILVLMFILASTALDRIQKNLQYVESIVNHNNTKTRLVSQMRTAARDRTVAIMRMVITNDSFARDDAFEEFNQNGGQFIDARIRLMQMDLTDQEQHLLKQQSKLTIIVVPIQREITDLAIMEQISQARDLLLQQAIPKQDEVFELLTQLQKLQEQSAAHIVKIAKSGFQSTHTKILSLAMMISIVCFLVAVFVIRRTVASERNLFREKELAIVTLHSIGDAVITTNKAGQVETLNSVAEELTGWSSSYAFAMPITQICRFLRDHDHKLVENPVLKSLKNHQVIKSDTHNLLLRDDGSEFAIEYSASPIFDNLKRIQGSVLVFRDVTEMRALSNQLSYQATHDSLTSLINRREFESRLEYAIHTAANNNEQHILCYLDLDQFKLVNDTCGHIAGDELLKQIAITLRVQIRESDIIARLGGDEFGILLRNCEIEKAKQLIETIRASINDIRFVWDEKSFNIGLSVGIVQITAHSGNLYNLLSAADTACYVAKDQGRNRFHVYQLDDDTLIKREGEMQWVHKINHALEENRFKLYYQTIVPINPQNKQLHHEILLRLISEDNKIIRPMAFIPAAERYDLMPTIDRWVVTNTLEKLSYKDNYATELFFINLSAQSICDDTFLAFITRQINNTGINPKQLCFEITETSAIVNLSQAMEFISSLKKLGCQFALDDFGSGLSSFAYLKNLPVDYLKIDGGFIQDILDDPMDLAFVESINQIGHVMKIKTIAEFVENKKIFQLLQKIGIDYAQGYWFDRPKPLSELLSKKSKTA